jgi:prepilin-type processing-associated H-X9-DG protein
MRSVTVSGNRPDLAWYDSEKVQTYGVHPHLFRFSPGPVDRVSLAPSGPPQQGPEDDGMKPFKLSQIHRSAELMMMADAAQISNLLDPGGNAWAADTTLWVIQGVGTNFCHNWATLQDCQTQFPQGPDAGTNRDYGNQSEMLYGTTSYPGNGIDIRFHHMKNTTANALFCDGHVGSFHWKRPGLGGSDLQFKNFILDDLRKQDMKFAN